MHMNPPVVDMQLARKEAEIVMFNAVGDVLKKTGGRWPVCATAPLWWWHAVESSSWLIRAKNS